MSEGGRGRVLKKKKKRRKGGKEKERFRFQKTQLNITTWLNQKQF